MAEAGGEAGQDRGCAIRAAARPLVHFTAPSNWINDPNGLIWLNGRYHLFYQHNPHSCDWGTIHWGHAISDNLLDWEHLPIALPDTPEFCSFSGSAVIDAGNVSGLGQSGQAPLLAFYTAAKKADYTFQQQHLAYSNDGGLTWQDYAHNPIIACGERDVRDPKVFWSEEAGKWVMLLAIAWKHQVGIYHSDNLLDWEQVSAFEVAETYVGEWECPDLVQLTDPVTGASRWCMLVSVGEGAPAGDSGIQYFLGHFDGTHFHAEEDHGRWIDAGPDFYAAQSWSNLPLAQNRVVWTAWMSNRAYAARTPAPVWRGCHVLPREMVLHTDPAGTIRLAQHPVVELAARAPIAQDIAGVAVGPPGGTLWQQELADRQLDLSLAGLDASDGCVRLTLHQGDHRLCLIEIDYRAGEWRYIRDWAHFANPGKDTVSLASPFRFPGEFRDWRVIVDDTTLELFSGTGTTVLSLLLFPEAGPIAARLEADCAACADRLVLRTLGADSVATALNHHKAGGQPL